VLTRWAPALLLALGLLVACGPQPQGAGDGVLGAAVPKVERVVLAVAPHHFVNPYPSRLPTIFGRLIIQKVVVAYFPT